MENTDFHAPFLKKISLNPPPGVQADYPFTIPVFSQEFTIELSKPVTFLVGENGTGKSTLLEAIAKKAGFNLSGGSQNHTFADAQSDSPLAAQLRLSWLPKISTGFFMRAESFFNFASYIEQLAHDDAGILEAYGGKSLHSQSHGESFLALFKNRFWKQGIYLLDEPEAALSPMRQLSFLALINKLEKSGKAQFIIATHSPILLSYPGAEVLSFDGESIKAIDYRETEHLKLTKAFLASPERYFKHLFSDE
jgi:predicted ATPase